jgi:hypothetical protein
MSRKIIAAIGSTALGALTVVGISVASTGTAQASVCDDGFTLDAYYASVGDTATMDGLADNLVAMGCAI